MPGRLSSYKTSEELMALYEIAKAINSTLNLPDVLDLIMKMTMKYMGAEAGSIMLLNEKEELAVVVAHGLDMDKLKNVSVKIGDSISGRVALTGEPLLLVGKVDDKEFTNLIQRNEVIKSSLCVPLKVKDRLRGVLNLRKASSREDFTEEQLKFLSMIADQAAIAIENARLYDIERKIQQMKSDFVSMVSHELRTPLTSIIGFVDILITKELDRNKRKKYLAIIQEESSRLLDLINNLLDLSRLDAGRYEFKKEKINIIDIIKEAINVLSSQSDLHSIIFNPGVHLCFVSGDEDMLYRVIMNLLGNAIKYSPDGGDIVVSLTESVDTWEISVSDHGIGIPEEVIPCLFEKFYRGDSAMSTRIKGIGLGLANVKYILEVHGGSIRVESELDKGSRFTFYLPKEGKINED